jgi:hypothetical protein
VSNPKSQPENCIFCQIMFCFTARSFFSYMWCKKACVCIITKTWKSISKLINSFIYKYIYINNLLFIYRQTRYIFFTYGFICVYIYKYYLDRFLRISIQKCVRLWLAASTASAPQASSWCDEMLRTASLQCMLMLWSNLRVHRGHCQSKKKSTTPTKFSAKFWKVFGTQWKRQVG